MHVIRGVGEIVREIEGWRRNVFYELYGRKSQPKGARGAERERGRELLH